MLLSTLIYPLIAGATVVICQSNRINDIVHTLVKNNITIFVCVHSMYEKIINYMLEIINAKR